MFSPATVARKPGHRGEREVSRKPSRRESRMFPVEPVVLPPCFFCTGPTGAIGTRLSLRPLIEEGGNPKAKLARNARRDREGVFIEDECAHSASSLRKQGPIRRGPAFFCTVADGFCSNKRRWLWVPAFAGTTCIVWRVSMPSLRQISDMASHSRGAIRPSCASIVRPGKNEGVGNAGWPMHPQPRV